MFVVFDSSYYYIEFILRKYFLNSKLYVCSINSFIYKIGKVENF